MIINRYCFRLDCCEFIQTVFSQSEALLEVRIEEYLQGYVGGLLNKNEEDL